MSASLLDQAFVRELELLRVELRRRIAGVRAGEHRSLRRGASMEFAEHRPYAPGDDPRRVDWNAFARLGELVVRLYAAEEDVTLHLVLDASRSMSFGDPTKLDTARRIAAALGYLCLSGSERVSLSVCAGGGFVTRAPLRGRAKLATLLAALEGVESTGRAPIDRAVEAIVAGQGRRPGVAVVLSDLLDGGAGVTAARRLAAARHETTVVHVLTARELRPHVGGEATLVDAETGEQIDLSMDEAAVERYEAKLVQWTGDVRGVLMRSGVGYVKCFPGVSEREVLAGVLSAVGRSA